MSKPDDHENRNPADMNTGSTFSRAIYDPRPEYSRPILEINKEDSNRLLKRLRFLYGEEKAKRTLPELERVLKVHYAHKPEEQIREDASFVPEKRFSEKDVVLITYGDLIRGKEHSHLASLAFFLERPRMKGIFNTIHILPFFPYSSDRGFSVTNFKEVDPELGTWKDIHEIGKEYKLLFDGVLNHASAQSPGFQEVLNGHPQFKDFVITYTSPEEISPDHRELIRRPRTSDILTKFDSINGPIYVWTTFSPDQIDLNFKNPMVLMRVIDILLLYVRQGADIIRLDAVTYLWCELGTDCASLDETHEIIKLFRDILNIVAPRVTLLTETNVPHDENVSYFGNGHDEAQMVYNFALPPLVLHTFYSEDSTALTGWANKLEYPSNHTTFLNMLDTHDGVGLMGVKNILTTDEIDSMISKAKKRGAFVSYKTGEDGSDVPYEINTTWYGALNAKDSGEDLHLQVRRFAASRAISLVLRGVPAAYIHGLIGTENDPEVVKRSGSNRDINRTLIDIDDIDRSLEDPESKLSLIREELMKASRIRVSHSAYHPNGEQKVLDLSKNLFSVLRISRDGKKRILNLINVTNHTVSLEIPLSATGSDETSWHDLISKKDYSVEADKMLISMDPYDVIFLAPSNET